MPFANRGQVLGIEDQTKFWRHAARRNEWLRCSVLIDGGRIEDALRHRALRNRVRLWILSICGNLVIS